MRKNFKIITNHGFKDRKGYITYITIFNEKIKTGIMFEDGFWLVTHIESGLLIWKSSSTTFERIKEDTKINVEGTLKILNRTFSEQIKIKTSSEEYISAINFEKLKESL